MAKQIEACGYLNYDGQLRVALMRPGHAYSHVLTRDEAEMLFAELLAALETKDEPK